VSKPIEISHTQWAKLQKQLHQDFPVSVMAIKRRMKERLGFLPRSYLEYGRYNKNCVMLDFYSEKKRTWFMMKYSDYIQTESAND
jgi:hypothetical protein